jgi:hypothetical protein
MTNDQPEIRDNPHDGQAIGQRRDNAGTKPDTVWTTKRVPCSEDLDLRLPYQRARGRSTRANSTPSARKHSGPWPARAGFSPPSFAATRPSGCMSRGRVHGRSHVPAATPVHGRDLDTPQPANPTPVRAEPAAFLTGPGGGRGAVGRRAPYARRGFRRSACTGGEPIVPGCPRPEGGAPDRRRTLRVGRSVHRESPATLPNSCCRFGVMHRMSGCCTRWMFTVRSSNCLALKVVTGRPDRRHVHEAVATGQKIAVSAVFKIGDTACS